SAGEDDQSHAEPYRQVLGIRYSLPAGLADFADVEIAGPHQSRRISYLALDAIHNSANGGLGRLKFRPAYYDNLDFGKHQTAGSALSMGELDLVVIKNKPRIRE